MRREIFDYLDSLGYQPPNDGQWRSIFHIILDAKVFLSKAGKDPEEIAEFVSHVENIINQIEEEGNGSASIVPGVTEILQECHTRGIINAIITLNRSKNVRAVLQQFGIAKYFKIVAGRDCVEKYKPDPVHSNFILNELQLHSAECLMVGDHPNDLETARNAHISFAAIITERHPKEEFQGARYFISQNKMQDLMPVIRKLL